MFNLRPCYFPSVSTVFWCSGLPQVKFSLAEAFCKSFLRPGLHKGLQEVIRGYKGVLNQEAIWGYKGVIKALPVIGFFKALENHVKPFTCDARPLSIAALEALKSLLGA